ncbi:MAG TPA: hypothetical protein VKW04_00575 [Planctomycetota bacterium]|nr:hypothetical protein [Planctomycetota bacterium]
MDYFSFEDVMKELELGEEELKRMVSEGELRAFRDENKMKFKKEDVESLKKGRITEPTIILPSTPSSETTDETVLDLDIGQETAALSDTSAQLAAVGGKGRREEEDLVVPSEEVGSDQEETFIEEDTDTGLSTEPLKLADETAEETVAAEAVEEEAPPPPPTRKRSGMTGQQRKVTARIPVAVEQEIEKKRAHPVWTLFVFLALLASLYSGFFFVDMVRLESGQASAPSDVTAGTAEWVLKKFWEDPKWRGFHERKFEGKAPPFTDSDPRIKHQGYNGPTFLHDKEYAQNQAGGNAGGGGAAPNQAPATEMQK